MGKATMACPRACYDNNNGEAAITKARNQSQGSVHRQAAKAKAAPMRTLPRPYLSLITKPSFRKKKKTFDWENKPSNGQVAKAMTCPCACSRGNNNPHGEVAKAKALAKMKASSTTKVAMAKACSQIQGLKASNKHQGAPMGTAKAKACCPA